MLDWQSVEGPALWACDVSGSQIVQMIRNGGNSERSCNLISIMLKVSDTKKCILCTVLYPEQEAPTLAFDQKVSTTY